MPDSVYDQTIDIVATDIKTLADALDVNITTESAVATGPVEWSDILTNLVSVCFDWDAIVADNKRTNARDMRGYPCYVVYAMPRRDVRDTRRKALFNLKEDVRQYFNHRKRMSGVSASDTNEVECVVTDGGLRVPKEVADKKHVQVQTIMAWFMEPRTA